MSIKETGVMIIGKVERSSLFLLVQDTIYTDEIYLYQNPQRKFPGGGVKLGETMIQGAIREAREETNLVLRPGCESGLVMVYPYPKYERDDSSPYEREVKKAFYFAMLEDFYGQLRTVPILDGKDTISPPYWINAMDDSEMRKIYKTHRSAGWASLRYYVRNIQQGNFLVGR